MKINRDLRQFLLAAIGSLICGVFISISTDDFPILVGLIVYCYLKTTFTLNGIQKKLDLMEKEAE